VAVVAGVLAFASLSTWLFAADERGVPPAGEYVPRPVAKWLLSGADGETIRRDALAQGVVQLPAGFIEPPGARPAALEDSPIVCRFLNELPSGTSAKFTCVLDGGDVIKVKYSRNPEINAEAASTALLSTLGLAADHVRIVPRLRCYGCPRYPFITSQLLWVAGAQSLLTTDGFDDGYTDFEWVAVERRFPAPAIETESQEGWAWHELRSRPPDTDLDAFRLLAVFLAHWDNKAENQRLVCLDDGPMPSDHVCSQPLLMIQDLGATFGPTKVNLAGWRDRPLWADRRRCVVSMKASPFQGATFTDVEISEAGRVLLGRRLAALSVDEIRRLFAGARFPEFYSATDDERDLENWTAAFRSRVDQILSGGPCPE
jgi:hypothetical protein